MSSDVERIARGFYEAGSSLDLESMASLLADDVLYEDMPGKDVRRGKDGMIAAMGEFFVASPDLKFEVKSLFASGNLAACEGIQSGTYEGKSFSERFSDIFEIHEGKITRFSSIYV
jgi:steroid delta-isomerase-like uncharacterized protein